MKFECIKYRCWGVVKRIMISIVTSWHWRCQWSWILSQCTCRPITLCILKCKLNSDRSRILKHKFISAKKVVSDRPTLVDFPICLVNSVLKLPINWREFKLQKNCTVINAAHLEFFFLAGWKNVWLVHASYSLPRYQAVKLTLFTPWYYSKSCAAYPIMASDLYKIDLLWHHWLL